MFTWLSLQSWDESFWSLLLAMSSWTFIIDTNSTRPPKFISKILTNPCQCPIINNKNGLSDFQFIVASRDAYSGKLDCPVLHKNLAFYKLKKRKKIPYGGAELAKIWGQILTHNPYETLQQIIVWQYWWIWIFDNLSFKFLVIFALLQEWTTASFIGLRTTLMVMNPIMRY